MVKRLKMNAVTLLVAFGFVLIVVLVPIGFGSMFCWAFPIVVECAPYPLVVYWLCGMALLVAAVVVLVLLNQLHISIWGDNANP